MGYEVFIHKNEKEVFVGSWDCHTWWQTNCIDNKSHWGVKSGPTSPATSVNKEVTLITYKDLGLFQP